MREIHSKERSIAKWIMSCVYRTRHDGTSFTRLTIPIQPEPLRRCAKRPKRISQQVRGRFGSYPREGSVRFLDANGERASSSYAVQLSPPARGHKT